MRYTVVGDKVGVLLLIIWKPDAISKASLPSVLVSCKCDTPPAQREIDPSVVEKKAKSFVSNLKVMQTSGNSPESTKKGLSMILKAIMAGNARTYTALLFVPFIMKQVDPTRLTNMIEKKGHETAPPVVDEHSPTQSVPCHHVHQMFANIREPAPRLPGSSSKMVDMRAMTLA